MPPKQREQVFQINITKLKIPTDRRQTSWLLTERDQGFELEIACVAGVQRGGKGERRAREARGDRTREDRGRGRLQGRYCFLHSAL